MGGSQSLPRVYTKMLKSGSPRQEGNMKGHQTFLLDWGNPRNKDTGVGKENGSSSLVEFVFPLFTQVGDFAFFFF